MQILLYAWFVIWINLCQNTIFFVNLHVDIFFIEMRLFTPLPNIQNKLLTFMINDSATVSVGVIHNIPETCLQKYIVVSRALCKYCVTLRKTKTNNCIRRTKTKTYFPVLYKWNLREEKYILKYDKCRSEFAVFRLVTCVLETLNKLSMSEKRNICLS